MNVFGKCLMSDRYAMVSSTADAILIIIPHTKPLSCSLLSILLMCFVCCLVNLIALIVFHFDCSMSASRQAYLSSLCSYSSGTHRLTMIPGLQRIDSRCLVIVLFYPFHFIFFGLIVSGFFVQIVPSSSLRSSIIDQANQYGILKGRHNKLSNTI